MLTGNFLIDRECPRLPRVVNPCDLETKSNLFKDLESGNGDWAKRSPEFTGVVCRMLRSIPKADGSR